MNTLSTLGKNAFGIKNFFKNIENSVREEQKEIFFHRKSLGDETEYFNFIKFLFSNPEQSKISS
ncbi:MAG TPA: hypothetical protein VMR77_00355 [Patescibacteria group bacterium]|jgi:hypothetical protein|nr:hypothetical protein [Patescibacteria group bacterium]